MKISFVPQRNDNALTVSKAGDVLTINGEVFDFSSLPDGATLLDGDVPCEWITRPITRVEGQLQLSLILPHGPNPSVEILLAPPLINPPDGPVAIPLDPVED